ncbi:hypothetical protein ACROYT_G006916 [Oculina patagonica]
MLDVKTNFFLRLSFKEIGNHRGRKRYAVFIRIREESEQEISAFEVSGYLKYQARQDRPDVEELEKLANSVEEFTTCLIDPLKSDTKDREAFGDSLDLIIDKAIEYNQGKFLSHPVVYNLLEKVWRGRFAGLRSKYRWKWTLLKLYSLLDIILFPFMFVFLFGIHSINVWRRKSKDLELCFILNATGKNGKDNFKKMIGCIKYMIQKIGVKSTNYCLISFKKGKAFQHIRFDDNPLFKNNKDRLINKLDALNPPVNCSPALHDDFAEASQAFKNQAIRITSKKVVILFTNDTTGSFGPQKGRLLLKTKYLTESIGARIVPVAVGERPVVEDLELIASENEVIRCPLEDQAKLGKRLLREVYEEDLYDRYLDYFSTPYFIFFRDTLSNLSVLGLHIAICLSPSVVPFSAVEWVIAVFFVGRLLSEFKQYNNKKTSKRLKRIKRLPSKHRNYVYQQSRSNHDEKLDLPIEVDDYHSRMAFSTLGKYFIDRWNVLDFIILVIYVVTFMLRMVTWGVSTSATGNRALVIAGYCYGLNTMFLTLRVFGHLMEASKQTGTTHIALMSIIEDVAIIFFQFLVGILAFSLAITKIYVAEGSFVSSEERLLRDKRSNADCNSSGLSCWWEILKHLCWTLLGMTELELFNTGMETPSDHLAQALYAVFIIAALVLLVNMMIAVLSNTYERVQKNSLREWSFKKAVTIRTYRDYHPIPVPLNLLSHPVLALCRDSENSNDLEDEIMEKKVEELDCMTEKLKVIYFAKYGFSFPLSDESKINSVLSETDRNREMCNQIVRRVFTDPEQRNDLFRPFGRLAWKSQGIHIEDYMLTYIGPALCSRCQISWLHEFHGARYTQPFSEVLPRFEVIVQEGGMKRDLVVGVVRAKHDVHKAAGEVRHTVGYHACNGHIVYCDDSGKQTFIEAPVVYRGDLIGCRAGFDEVDEGKIPIFFSLNGETVAQISVKLRSEKQDIFPFVGMKHKGIRVLAKMCPGEPKDSNEKRSSGSHDDGFGSMFSEDQQTMVLYQTFDSVEEMKVTSDVLLQYMQEKIEKITDDVKVQKENIKSIENTIEIQNKKIDGINNTLSEILNILKFRKDAE